MFRSRFGRRSGLRATAGPVTALLVSGLLVLGLLASGLLASGVLASGLLRSASTGRGLSARLGAPAGPEAEGRVMPSSTPTPVSTAPRPHPPSVLAVAWRSHGFRPVSAPTVAGRTALVYGTIGTYLYLFALDSVTGAERWHEHASTGHQPSGISPYVVIVDDDVAFFRPDDPRDPYWAHLVRVDPLTGVDVVASPAMYWESSPDVCGPGRHDLCLPGSDGVGPVTAWTFTRPGALRAQPASREYRDLGSGVVDLLTRNPERIAHQDDSGRLIWSRPLAALFGPGVTTDAGWDFSAVGAHVVVGTVYHWDRAAETTRVKHADLSTDASTAAFDLRTGALLWQRRGVSNDCYFALSVYSGATMVPLRCAFTGRFVATYPKHGKPRLRTQAVTVSLQRYDPATGRTVWSLPLGNVASMYGQGNDIASLPVLDQTHVLVPRGRSQVVVDLGTGAFRAASPRDVFWCQPSVIFAQSPAKDVGGEAGASGISSGLVTTCSADRTPVSTGALSVPDSLGVAAGRLTLVSTPSNVMAYRSG